ncbi:MAG: hypothetical protein SVR08_08325 [Spirochaetota bacterium]|nr:hypothetical protein [Spirochaetota bacterium]
MNQNEQNKFSDNILFAGLSEVYQFIEEGRFDKAVKKLDSLLDINPDYPALHEGYRIAKFWDNRKLELKNHNLGKETADFLMFQWNKFVSYAEDNNITNSTAYRSAMKYIFQTASENYKIAFQSQESAKDNYDLLLNLGICFLTLGEYNSAIETLEYARSFYKSNAKFMTMLGEAYSHTGDSLKSMLYFKEAFFINPSDVDLDTLRSETILNLIEIVKTNKPYCADVREWIPIFGFTHGLFYARRQINSEQLEMIKREIYSLEKGYQTQSSEKIGNSNVVPRLINKYLWMLEYFKYQNYNQQSITEIKERLIHIDKNIFEDFFKNTEI